MTRNIKGVINVDNVKIEQMKSLFKEGFEKVPNKEELEALHILVDRFSKDAKNWEKVKTSLTAKQLLRVLEG